MYLFNRTLLLMCCGSMYSLLNYTHGHSLREIKNNLLKPKFYSCHLYLNIQVMGEILVNCSFYLHVFVVVLVTVEIGSQCTRIISGRKASAGFVQIVRKAVDLFEVCLKLRLRGGVTVVQQWLTYSLS